jgi:CHAT domain-containing protein
MFLFSSKERIYMIKHRRLWGLFLCSLCVCLWLGNIYILGITHPVKAQSTDASQLMQQGFELYQAGDVTKAIERWEKALNIYQQNNNQQQAGIALQNLARAYPEAGNLEQAIKFWDKLIASDRQTGNSQIIGRYLSEQAQIYSRLGKPQTAIQLLCNPDQSQECSSDSALAIARFYQDSLGEAAAFGALGDANRLTGNYNLSISYLKQSLQIANKLNNPNLHFSIFNSLANIQISLAKIKYRQANSAKQRGETQKQIAVFINEGKQEDAHALLNLQQNLAIARTQQDMLGEVRSLQQIIPLYYRSNNPDQAVISWQQASDLLGKLPKTRSLVYANINQARLLQESSDLISSKIACLAVDVAPTAETLLNQAATLAKQLQDFRAESFALGELGHIYECRQQYAKAIEFTKIARLAAEQALKSQDSLYLWEWQTGRIFKAQKKTKAAIFAYEQALQTLETIRSDFLTANRDIQFDFRDTIEPIYRELVGLRLSIEQPIQTVNKSAKTNQQNFSSILATIDSLKLAELQNYFGSDCIITPIQPKNINTIAQENTQTAFINTIILENKTAVILTLPGGDNIYSSIPISQPDLITKINDFRRGLETFRNNNEYDTALAQEVYNLLIKPFANFIKAENIKTLVFSQDGILRSVPMAALYDSVAQKFLIQEYAIATIPSLNLTDIKPLNRQGLKVLALGLSEDAEIDNKNILFKALENVPEEITKVLEKIPGKKLLNNDFTIPKLEAELNQQTYPIIHIATHGEFGTEAKDTFIVTGEKDISTNKHKTLNFNELEKKIRTFTKNNKLLELLTLTACKTAKGDERSTLGMAGVAVQSGAKSALASLWAIQDAPTVEIATEFYTKLLSNSKVSKAEALQAAQIALIEGTIKDGKRFTHPANWSPFILIGNWL